MVGYTIEDDPLLSPRVVAAPKLLKQTGGWTSIPLFMLCACAAMLCYLMRYLTAITLTGGDGMAQQFDWSNEQQGVVTSCLFYGTYTRAWSPALAAGRTTARYQLVPSWQPALSGVLTASTPLCTACMGLRPGLRNRVHLPTWRSVPAVCLH